MREGEWQCSGVGRTEDWREGGWLYWLNARWMECCHTLLPANELNGNWRPCRLASPPPQLPASSPHFTCHSKCFSATPTRTRKTTSNESSNTLQEFNQRFHHYTPPTQSSLFPTRLYGVINDMVVSDTSSRGNYRIINFCGHMRCSFASIRGGRKEAKMAGCGSRISALWVTNRVIEIIRTLVDILQRGWTFRRFDKQQWAHKSI